MRWQTRHSARPVRIDPRNEGQFATTPRRAPKPTATAAALEPRPSSQPVSTSRFRRNRMAARTIAAA
jgi:hypothetical protein